MASDEAVVPGTEVAPLRIKRSFRSVIPHVILAVIVAGFIFHYSREYSFYGFHTEFVVFGKKVILVFPLFLLVLGVLLARPIFLMKDTKHILASHHLYSESGRLSLSRQHVEVAFEEMLGVRFHQNLLERILDVGTIVAWTASADRPEIIMKGVQHPEEVTRMIRQRIDQIILQRGKSREH